MGCIETPEGNPAVFDEFRLTLTWDVLKRKKGNALQDGQTD